MTARLVASLRINSRITVTEMQGSKLSGFNRDGLLTEKKNIQRRLMNHQTRPRGTTMVQGTSGKVADLAMVRFRPKP
jgi:hypothetical protein